jgi:phage FluMu gp28-like protein
MRMGVDIGSRHDAFVIIVVEEEDGIFFIRHIKRKVKLDFSDMKNEIAECFRLYDITKLNVDETGMGIQLGEELIKQYGSMIVTPYSLQSKTKEKLITRLRKLFEGKKIRIPDNEQLIKELHDLKREIHETTTKYTTDAREHHCDMVWALALAVYIEESNESDRVIVGEPHSIKRRLGLRKYI